MSTDSIKGKRISISGGTYAKCGSGWLDLSKPKTKEHTYVIVDLGEGMTKCARVKHGYIEDKDSKKEAKTFEEAVLMQHPDINKTMNKLVTQLVETGIDVNGRPPAIVKIFHYRLKDAMEKQHAKPIHKARWRKTIFGRGGDGHGGGIQED